MISDERHKDCERNYATYCSHSKFISERNYQLQYIPDN